jgi:dolichol-phosphate mannosyltransferase
MLVATLAAMVSNFVLNNAVTWRDARLRGVAWVRGLITFCLLCGVGAIANIGVASTLFAQDGDWWLAGAAGALVGVVWNYAMSTTFVWRTT